MSDGEVVAGIFHSINVYQVRGITTDTKALGPHLGQVDETSYKAGTGSSINSICQQLLGENFSEDEGGWQNFKKCSPPYLAVIFSTNQEYKANGQNYIKNLDDKIETYDSFYDAKLELQRREAIVLPRLLTALSSVFSLVHDAVKFFPIDRSIFGKTREGKTIFDILITLSGTGHTSRKVDDEEMRASLSDAIELTSKLNAKIARFYFLALQEDDLLKRFLYFFLTIEIKTHATFSDIDHTQRLSDILVPPPRVTRSAKNLFDKQRKEWRAVKDRFAWCVVCAWSGLS